MAIHDLFISYSCVHCWSTANKHTPMSPLLASTHPTHTHVSIAGQHPPSTHPCLHCWPAPTQHKPMSPLLANTHPASTHVSISGQQAPTNAHQGHCCASPGRGLSTSTTPKLSEICYLTKVTWPSGFPYCNLYYEAGTPGRRQTNKQQQSGPLRVHNAAQAPSL